MSDDLDVPTVAPLQKMLCFDIYAANLAFGRIYKSLLSPLGLTYPQLLLLMVLWTKDGQSVGEIGEHLGLDSNTLTPMIKRLETANLVIRRRDDQDERRVIVWLTEQGHALQRHVSGILGCMFDKLGISDEQVFMLRDLLRKLRKNLDDNA